MAPIELTVVFDNVPADQDAPPELISLWGFAAVLELPRLRVLFDTGNNGRVLLKNMAALGIDPATIDLVFLSHMHWDHIGGLDSVLELNPDATLVLHDRFSPRLLPDLERLCGRLVVVGEAPERIAPGLHSSGRLDADPPEQALLVEVIDAGGRAATAVIAGCAHPGIERIVARAREVLGRPVDLAVGGFHLFGAEPPAIDACIAGLKAQQVHRVLPTHCTGELARAAFRAAWGDRFIDGGPGRSLVLGEPFRRQPVAGG